MHVCCCRVQAIRVGATVRPCSRKGKWQVMASWFGLPAAALKRHLKVVSGPRSAAGRRRQFRVVGGQDCCWLGDLQQGSGAGTKWGCLLVWPASK